MLSGLPVYAPGWTARVSHKEKAFREIKRVLKQDGYATITTNSARHMRVVYDIGKRLDPNFPTDRIIDSFTEEIADEILPKNGGQ